MMKLSTQAVAGLLFLIIGTVYLAVASVPNARYERTILEIVLSQPHAYWQTILGAVCGFYIGSTFGTLSMTWRKGNRSEQRQTVIGLALVIIVCLQMFTTGRSTIASLLVKQGSNILLYILPFNFACAAFALFAAGVTCLRRGPL